MPRDRVLVTSPLAIVGVVLALVVGLVVGRVVFGGARESQAGPARAAGLRVDVIVKASDSSFWQSMYAGAARASENLGVEVGLFGPTSETDIPDQVQLVENSISRRVDAIVLAANSATALDQVITRARQAGIAVITVDGRVSADSEAFIGTDNLRAGQQAGATLCALMTAQGHTRGTVLLENAIAGVQALGDRALGFRQGLAGACPGIAVAPERFNNGDQTTAVGQTSDAITAVGDLVGIFAANDASANGVARAVAESGRAATLPVVGFDSDPQENAALATGVIDALVVQNPYFFGYQGVSTAVAVRTGTPVPRSLDPGAVVVDSSNANDPDNRVLLDPPKIGAGR